ncbi:hypothetical protein LCGC14_1093840 [marine sediment metagenome]|uniref:Uncharacterized protein n=1 Tax=marine sediment metagenome TaxID=412755 RepID=A0A0F9MZC5_9ZZZZ
MDNNFKRFKLKMNIFSKFTLIIYVDNDGVKICYEIEGIGFSAFLIHGFSGNLEVMWKQITWVESLKDN